MSKENPNDQYEFFKNLQMTNDGRLLVDGIAGGGGGDPFADGFIMTSGYSTINLMKLSTDGLSQGLSGDITGTDLSEYGPPEKIGGLLYDKVNDIIIACTLTGSIYYSTDQGTSWTVTNIITVGKSLRGLAFDGTTYVCVGGSATTNASFYSVDGITWTAGSAFTNTTIQKVIHNGTNFIGVGYGSSDSTRIITSSDGITWTVRTDAWATNARSYGVGVSNTGRVVMSSYSDGLSTQKPFAYSDDNGLTWTESNFVTSNTYSFGYTVLWSDTYNKFYSIGYSNNGTSNVSCILSSADGIAWSVEATSTKTSAEAAAYQMVEDTTKGEIIAFSYATIIKTTDGSAWTYDYDGYPGEKHQSSQASIFIDLT